MTQADENQISEQKLLIDRLPNKLLFSILDNPHESTVIVDSQGKILFMSKSYKKIGVTDINNAIGKNIRDVLPHSKVYRVLETGRAEIAKTIFVDGKDRLVSRVPILSNGKIIGAIGKVIFWEPEKIKEMEKVINLLQGKIKHYKKRLKNIYRSRYSVDNIIGRTPSILSAKEMVEKSSRINSPVLITGESGTGKELFAHAIHHMSQRKDFPFVRVNCSSIPKELMESELFGYEPGAFTGANPKGQKGKFSKADKGSIFLDEIGDLPMELQPKLLRAIQEKEIERLGGRPEKLDFRVIAATNRNLENMVLEKTFRLDLYYRLNVINISLPPLRLLKNDIKDMAFFFLNELKKDIPKDIKNISEEAMASLENHHWPGNVRELRNTMERAMINCEGKIIEITDLPVFLLEASLKHFPETKSSLLFRDQMAKAEKSIINNTLKISKGNRTLAAQILGIHRTGLQKKLKKYGITQNPF